MRQDPRPLRGLYPKKASVAGCLPASTFALDGLCVWCSFAGFLVLVSAASSLMARSVCNPVPHTWRLRTWASLRLFVEFVALQTVHSGRGHPAAVGLVAVSLHVLKTAIFLSYFFFKLTQPTLDHWTGPLVQQLGVKRQRQPSRKLRATVSRLGNFWPQTL